MEKMLLKLNGFYPMPTALEEFLRAHVQIETFGKKRVILKAGRICRHVYFIETGLVRHVVDMEGRTYTPWILREGEIATSVKSFFFQVPAIDSLVTIEETTVVYLCIKDLEEGCRLYSEMAVIREKVKNKYYDLKEDRDHQLGLLGPEERYQYLLKTDPELTVRVPVEILSSYLGMSSKKLYEIRRELTGAV